MLEKQAEDAGAIRHRLRRRLSSPVLSDCPGRRGSVRGRVVALEVEVDPYDMRIVDAACDCLPALGRKLLVSLLVGRKLEDGLTGVIADVRSRYSSITQRAMIAALEDVLRRCAEHGIMGRRSTRDPDRNPKG